jgi:hypothetical protein
MPEGLTIAPGLSWERSGLAHVGGINSGPGLITEAAGALAEAVLLTETDVPVLSETGDVLIATLRLGSNGQ